MPKLLNTELLSNWQNWARVLLMVAIGTVAFSLGAKLLSKKDK